MNEVQGVQEPWWTDFSTQVVSGGVDHTERLEDYELFIQELEGMNGPGEVALSNGMIDFLEDQNLDVSDDTLDAAQRADLIGTLKDRQIEVDAIGKIAEGFEQGIIMQIVREFDKIGDPELDS